MSLPPHNASLRPDDGEPADALVVAQHQQDDPFDSRERNPKRQRTEGAAPVSVQEALRTRMCTKFSIEMGDGLWETARNMMCVAALSKSGLERMLIAAVIPYATDANTTATKQASLQRCASSQNRYAWLTTRRRSPIPTTIAPRSSARGARRSTRQRNSRDTGKRTGRA